jgi:hypothetical protein
MLLICLFGLFAAARPASAEVTTIEFTTKQPYGTFRTGEYAMWQGRIHGELSPQEIIPGIDNAARNERGRIAYSAKIILIKPTASGAGNGALLVDIPNRGNAYVEALIRRAMCRFSPARLNRGRAFCRTMALRLPRSIGSSDMTQTCLHSSMPTVRNATLREWGSRLSAMPQTSSRMPPPIQQERPTHSRE